MVSVGRTGEAGLACVMISADSEEQGLSLT
jgi:hypothetical protein